LLFGQRLPAGSVRVKCPAFSTITPLEANEAVVKGDNLHHYFEGHEF
jgi:hypothetical protein